MGCSIGTITRRPLENSMSDRLSGSDVLELLRRKRGNTPSLSLVLHCSSMLPLPARNGMRQTLTRPKQAVRAPHPATGFK